MLPPPHVCNTKTAMAVMLAVGGLCLHMGCTVRAQGFTAPFAGSAPLGLRTILPSGDMTEFGLVEGLKGGFDYGVGVQSVYDSNFFLSETSPQSELTINILPWIHYRSDPEGGAPFSFTASYQPNIRTYLNNPDLDGIDHSGSVTMQVKGAKTLIAAYMNYNTVSGTDRLSGTFVNGTLLEAGIKATYQIAPRTSLFASWKLAMSDYGESTLVGADIYTAELGGFWSATERFSLGPSIRYVKAESANTGTRDEWAFNMQARYLMGTRLQFVGSLGLQTATNSREAGNSTFGLTGRLAANYAITEKLLWVNSVRYETVPSPTDANYVINNLMVSTALTRQLLRSTVSLGLEMNMGDYVDVGTVGTQLGKENNLSIILAYHRKLYSDRVDLSTSIRYTLNNGRDDWSQLQIAAGIQIQF